MRYILYGWEVFGVNPCRTAWQSVMYLHLWSCVCCPSIISVHKSLWTCVITCVHMCVCIGEPHAVWTRLSIRMGAYRRTTGVSCWMRFQAGPDWCQRCPCELPLCSCHLPGCIHWVGVIHRAMDLSCGKNTFYLCFCVVHRGFSLKQCLKMFMELMS